MGIMDILGMGIVDILSMNICIVSFSSMDIVGSIESTSPSELHFSLKLYLFHHW